MSIIVPANSAVGGGYAVDNSVRFNNSEYLQRTNGTATDDKKYSLSFWVKRSKLGEDDRIFNNQFDASNWGYLMFKSDNTIRIADRQGDADRIDWITTQVFRDISAWYHFYLAIDTTQGTADNRVKFYVNGTQVTAFTKTVSPSLNNALGFQQATATNLARIATADGGGNLFSGYMSEIVFIDGTQNAVTDFGEFDEDSGIFKPIDVSGLTFGNNGYYLNFQDSAELGTDISGESNTYTEVNLTAIDQTTDTPTNNFATWNSLVSQTAGVSGRDASAQPLLEDGNLSAGSGNATFSNQGSTLGITQGKWYAEFQTTGDNYAAVGIVNNAYLNANLGSYLGGVSTSGTENIGYQSSSGAVVKNNSTQYTASTYTTAGDIVGIAVDLDNNKLYFRKNNDAWNNSGNPESGATGTGAVSITADTYFIACTAHNNTGASEFVRANFGNAPYAISSGNTDGNGYGNFEYAVPSGYLSLCTANLSEVLG